MPNNTFAMRVMNRVYTRWLLREVFYPAVFLVAAGFAGLIILDAYVTFGIVLDDLRPSLTFLASAFGETEIAVQSVLIFFAGAVGAVAYRIAARLKTPLSLRT